jgi:Na+/melibiose symporter-like transporter
MAGAACIDVTAVIPVFLNNLTDSTVVIGAVLGIRCITTLIPQIFIARFLSHRVHAKPTLLICAYIGRVPLVFFSGWLLWGASNRNEILATFIPVYGMFMMMDACCWVPWTDMLNRTLPPRVRGWYFGWWQFFTGLLSLVSGLFVSWALKTFSFPRNFGWLHAGSAVGVMLSIFLLSLIKEPKRVQTEDPQQTFKDYIDQIRIFWHSDPAVRLCIITSAFIVFFNLSVNFYVLDAKQLPGASPVWVGRYVSAIAVGIAVGGILWNLIRDHYGTKASLIGIAITASLIPAAALVVREIGITAYIIPFVMYGLVSLSVWTIPTNYLLDHLGHGPRSLMVMGVINVIYGASMLLPIVGGKFLGFASYPLLFALTFLLTVPSVYFAIRLPKAR